MYNTSEATIPLIINKSENKIVLNILAIFGGVLLLSLLARVSITLPWTPIPITGQTFGVALVALSWGRKRATLTFLSYLLVGYLGAPVFASGKSGLIFGPRIGYLVGMLGASFLVGLLADKGFTKTFVHSLFAAFIGSVTVFSCGLLVLSFFVPQSALLSAGLFPFIPGDILKNTLAALFSWKFREWKTGSYGDNAGCSGGNTPRKSPRRLI